MSEKLKKELPRGLAISAPHDMSLVKQVIRQGFIPTAGYPRQLAKSGSTAVLVGNAGAVLVQGKVDGIEGPTKVTLVDGLRRSNGYKVHLKAPSAPKRHRPLSIQFLVNGQMRYFNPVTWKPVLVGDIPVGNDSEHLDSHPGPAGEARAIQLPFSGGAHGRALNGAESRLLRAYVRWIGEDAGFTQYRLDPEGWVVDLFDSAKWRLIEAEPVLTRQRLRTALGQLLDYTRYFDRAPRLGILIPARPSPKELAFLSDNKVTAIWRTPSGQFGDSADGKWTKHRRL